MRRAGTQDSKSDRPVVFTIGNTSVNSEHTWRYSLIKRRCRDDALNLDGDFWQVALVMFATLYCEYVRLYPDYEDWHLENDCGRDGKEDENGGLGGRREKDGGSTTKARNTRRNPD